MPKKTQKKTKKLEIKKRILQPVKRMKSLRARRAHKSFLLTRRRDIPKPSKLPGYFAFTKQVGQTVWRFRRPFAVLLGLYFVASFVLIGISQQSEYRTIADAVRESSAELEIDSMTRVGLLFGSTALGSLNESITEVQQLYLVVLYILTWLVIVWMLRHLLAENFVKVRDGLYNAGAPLVPTILIAALMLVQAIPGTIGVLVFSAATSANMIAGVVGMMIGVAALLLIILSLYWLASSFLALVIVTLPGTYPMSAIRGAGDIALGRRMSLLFRLLWLVVLLALMWAMILFPALLLDEWTQVAWIPFLGIALQLASGLSFIFGVTYIYLLYRRMIDEPAE